ncbi:MAG: VanW family protein [Polyangiaceae bacterium]|nr:VanW family protein [Polyangiaceae bacterium]
MRAVAVQGRTVALVAALLALLAGGGGAVAYVLRPVPIVRPPAPDIPVPALRVAGHAVPAEGDVIGESLNLVRRYALGEVKLRMQDGRELAISRADFGLEIDRLRLAEFVKEARVQGSPIGRAHARSQRAAEPIDVPLPIVVDGERALAKLVDLKASVDSPSQDAFIDLETRKVKPEKVGYRLDVYTTLARLEAAFRRGETSVDAAVEEVVPKRVSAQLDGIDFDTVLGYFETRYNTAKKYADRTYNLRLAASKLDGMVLLPGEIFDFNEVVGPRDEANGYKVATVIAQGELVDGIGGGTCQVSGTLHSAAFFAGLEIVERYPHSRPSSYIALGLDATVSYPNITYRFRNNFDFPVVLHEKVAGGVVRAEILGPSRKLTVSYFRRIDDIVAFEEVERESEKLPSGERVVVQRGVPGFVATSSRLVRDGAYGERTKWTERYPPTTQIVAIGTGPSEREPALKQDAHPEYTVDEYRVMTQGPGLPNNGMTDHRVPGRTGVAGWIKALGLEKTPLDDDDEGGMKDDEPPAKDKTPSKSAKKDGEKKDGEKKAASKKGGDKQPEKAKDPAKVEKKKKKKEQKT